MWKQHIKISKESEKIYLKGADIMDIYSFIEHGRNPRSKEIAEHCKKIGQTWTPFEMALIIGNSNRAMAEKHAAWRELMADYPDMPTYANKDHPVYDSFHKKLIEFMDYEELLTALFMKQEQGTYYTYHVDFEEKHDEEEHDDFFYHLKKEHYSPTTRFSTFKEAWANAESYCKSYESDDSLMMVTEVSVSKNFAGSGGCYISADFDTKGNLYDIFTWAKMAEKFYPGIDCKIPYMFRWDYYVYMPLPWVDRYIMLDEKERMLFYEIQRIYDQWDPLILWRSGCPSDEYCSEALDLTKILLAGGGEKELHYYLDNRFERNCKAFVEKIMKLKQEI